MLLSLVLLLAAHPAAPAHDRAVVLHGECIYPPAIAEKLPDAAQVTCDTVALSGGEIDFRQDGWDAHSRFFGTWNGDVLTVTAIQPRGQRRSDADGECRIDYANGAISMVSCSAFGNGRGWLANFRNVRP
jgi:hypothetical protein